MKKSLESLFAFTTGSTLIFSPSAFAQIEKSACDDARHKESVHCVAMTSLQGHSGKYIKIKESLPGQAATTKIFCATEHAPVLMSLPQYKAHGKTNMNFNWQISQCSDEDCSTSNSLLSDKFTISKTGKAYTTNQKSITVNPDPSYGVDCVAPYNSAMQMRIDDAVELIESIPTAMANTLDTLKEMRNIAMQATSGNNSSSQLGNLDILFQAYKQQMDAVQRVNTLDGFKNVSGGTLSIQIGSWSMSSMSLDIPFSAFNQDALDIARLDVATHQDAYDALDSIETAIESLHTNMAFKKN